MKIFLCLVRNISFNTEGDRMEGQQWMIGKEVTQLHYISQTVGIFTLNPECV